MTVDVVVVVVLLVEEPALGVFKHEQALETQDCKPEQPKRAVGSGMNGIFGVGGTESLLKEIPLRASKTIVVLLCQGQKHCHRDFREVLMPLSRNAI